MQAGYHYLLTVIDCSTLWFQATPLQEITAEAVLDCFVSSRIEIQPACSRDHGQRGAIPVRHVVYMVH